MPLSAFICSQNVLFEQNESGLPDMDNIWCSFCTYGVAQTVPANLVSLYFTFICFESWHSRRNCFWAGLPHKKWKKRQEFNVRQDLNSVIHTNQRGASEMCALARSLVSRWFSFARHRGMWAWKGFACMHWVCRWMDEYAVQPIWWVTRSWQPPWMSPKIENRSWARLSLAMDRAYESEWRESKAHCCR